MVLAISSIFSFLTAAAGWYYLFYSPAATNLSRIEAEKPNRLRQRLRQACGVAMLLLAAAFFAGFNTFDPRESPSAFVITWFAVFLLLMIVVILVMIDLRLTMRLRGGRKIEP